MDVREREERGEELLVDLGGGDDVRRCGGKRRARLFMSRGKRGNRGGRGSEERRAERKGGKMRPVLVAM